MVFLTRQAIVLVLAVPVSVRLSESDRVAVSE